MCKLEVFFNKRPTASVSLMKAQKNIISVVEHVVQGRKALWGMKDDNFLFDCILCVVGKRKFAPHSGGMWSGLAWTDTRTKFGLANGGERQLFGDRKKKTKQKKR